MKTESQGTTVLSGVVEKEGFVKKSEELPEKRNKGLNTYIYTPGGEG